MATSLKNIADIVNGQCRGPANFQIKGVASLENAGPEDISFVSAVKYLNQLDNTRAGALLIDSKLYTDNLSIPCVLVDNVYESLSLLLDTFSTLSEDIHEDRDKCSIADDAIIGEDVRLGVFSIVSKGVHIGRGSRILGQVYLGPEVSIGENCIIYPGVRVYNSCSIGNNVIIHSNAVIGSDGFGFAPLADGSFKKIPQIGNVIIEDNVEVGANTVIDRASMGSTIIKEGVKLDNLIQIAHSVELGSHTVIAAQAGIAGSTRVGSGCQIGGQAGIVGHISIADGTRIQAQSGMTKNVSKEGTKWYGSPAIDYNNYLKSFAIYKNLPDLQSRINELEKLLRDVQQKLK